MNLHTFASWAFGFFAIPIFAACIGVAIGAISLCMDMFERASLDPFKAWSGVFLFAAVAVVSGVIAANVIK